MISLREVDLVGLDPDEPVPDGPVWILVRKNDHVLGEIRLPEDRPESTDSLLDFLMMHFVKERATYRLERSDAPPTEGPVASDVTIVICTHDRPDHLRACLDAMANLDPPAGRIVVVDNGPATGETARVAAAYDVTYVLEPNLGLNRARNAGWRAAETPLVAYVDDDARVDRRYARAVAAGFLDDMVGAVTGLVLPAELATPAQVTFERNGGMRKGYERLLFSPGSVGVQSFRLGVGTNMAFRRTALELIGGFDESIGVGTPSRGGGDLDALWRVLEGGLDVLYEPNAIVRHFHRRTRKGLVQQYRDYGTAYAATLSLRARDHSRRAATRELLRWHVRRHLLDLIDALRTGDRARLRLLRSEAAGSWAWHRRPRPRALDSSSRSA